MRDKRGRFVPGQSGNRSGRPKIIAEMRELARRHTPDAIARLAAEMMGGDCSAARIAAANALLDRAWGRPTQPLAGDESMDPIRVTDARDALLAHLDRLIAAAEAPAVADGGANAGAGGVS